MKKSFPLELPDRKPARVIEAIKHDVRKYVKRERRKKLPEGGDFWDFDCRVGPDAADAEEAHVAEINQKIDLAASEKWSAVFIEILAKPGHRLRKPQQEDDIAAETQSEDASE